MSELHTNLYIKHLNPEVNAQLGGLFKTINDSQKPNYDKIEDELHSFSIGISPAKGADLVNGLIKSVKDAYGSPSEDLVAESRSEIAGYHSLHFVHGGSGTDIIGAILQFIGELTPEVDVRACLVGDDEPWEVFYRYENGALVNKYYEPDYDEIEEDELPDVYLWWHDGLPSEIKDGFINDWLEEEDEDE